MALSAFIVVSPGREVHHLFQAMTDPLLSIGTFGTHVVEHSGLYSFVGTVPNGIKVGPYSNKAESIEAFVCWFKNQDINFQREQVGSLRNDVFAAFITA